MRIMPLANWPSFFFRTYENVCGVIHDPPRWAIWELRDADGKRLDRGRIASDGKGNPVTLQSDQQLDPGVYTLHVVRYLAFFWAVDLVAPVKVVVAERATPDDRFGVNVGTLPLDGVGDSQRSLVRLAGSLGVRVRTGIRWSELDPGWSPRHRSEAIWKAVFPVGVHAPGSLFVLGLGHPDYTDFRTVEVTTPDGTTQKWRQGTPQTPEQIKHFERYVEQVLVNAGDAIGSVQVWNEGDQSFMLDVPESDRPRASKLLVDATRRVVDRVAPHIKVIAGSHARLDLDTIRTYQAAGVYENADAVSFHEYPTTHDGISYHDLRELKRIVGDREIWCTEFGFLSEPLPAELKGHDEREHAFLIFKSLVRLLAGGVDKVFYYHLSNLGESIDGPDDRRRHFGLVRSAPDHHPKLALAAYATVAGWLAGAKYEATLGDQLVAGKRESLHRCCFRGPNGQARYALWLKSWVRDKKIIHPEATIRFEAADADAHGVDWDGSPLDLSQPITLSEGRPILLSGDYTLSVVE